MQTAMSGATPQAQGDPWFRTRSPERAIHRCETACHPHRLRLLGPSKSFGLTQRVTSVGPVTIGEVTYETDVAIRFDEARATYHACVPLEGRLETRHRGQQVTSTPTLASVTSERIGIAMQRGKELVVSCIPAAPGRPVGSRSPRPDHKLNSRLPSSAVLPGGGHVHGRARRRHGRWCLDRGAYREKRCGSPTEGVTRRT
jgi:hypothetical protein